MRRRFGVAAALATLAGGLAAAPVRAAEQRLSAPGVRIVTGALVTGPSGGPFAAVWSETVAGGARLRVAFARPDGTFAAARVVLRTRLPVVTLGAAATEAGVLVAGAHLRRGGGESVLALEATRRATAKAVTLGRGPVVGRPPSVAASSDGDAIAAWQRGRRVIVARRLAGRWRAAALGGPAATPVVATSPDGTAVALVRRPDGRIDAARAEPGAGVGRPARLWATRSRQAACCAALVTAGDAILAAWGEGHRLRAVAAGQSGRPRTVLVAPTRDAIEAPPLGALAPDGGWALGWWDAGGHATAALGAPAAAVRTQPLPPARYAPLIGAAVAPGGAAAFVAWYFGSTYAVSRPAAGQPLRPRRRILGEPLGVALTPAGPEALVLRRSPHGDALVAAPA